MLAMDLNTIVQNPTIMFCAGMVMLAVVVVRWRKRKRSMDAIRRNEGPTARAVRENGPSIRDVREVAQELNELLAELQETARRIAAQIDNRYAKLDAMLAQADRRIQRLEQLQQLSGDVEHIGNGSKNAEPITPPPATMVDPKYKSIDDLADKGKTSREIAQQLGTQPGEVELILNLRGSQRVG